jgi:hypothetical protein
VLVVLMPGGDRRPLATRDGALRGRVRDGRTFYLLHYPLLWVLLRCAKVALLRPRLLSGAAFLGGYLQAAVSRAERVGDPHYRRWVRRELGQRALASLSPVRATR